MNREYWCKAEPDKLARDLSDRVEADRIFNNGLKEQALKSFSYYYGQALGATSFGVSRGGQNKELFRFYINQSRSLAQHLLSVVIGNPVAFKGVPINTSVEARESAAVADALLRTLIRTHDVDQHLRDTAEMAIITGEGFIRVDWDAHAGEPNKVSPSGTLVHEGDARISTFSLWDVVRPKGYKKFDAMPWLAVCEAVNRYEIVARYPELEPQIMGAPALTRQFERPLPFVDFADTDEIDLINVWTFYHKRTNAIPEGRETVFLENGIYLTDGPLAYKDIPVRRMVPGKVHTSSYGYTPLFDLLGVADAYNANASAVLTGLLTFGAPTMLIPLESGIKQTQMDGGGKYVFYDPTSGGEPKYLDPPKIPQESLAFHQLMGSTFETLLGVSPVSRGQNDQRLSGQALALLDSRTLQFAAPLQASFVTIAERVGRDLKNLYETRVDAPRVMKMLGPNDAYMVRSFVGKSLDAAEVSLIYTQNPLLNTPAGQAELANMMADRQILRDPEEYLDVYNTGRLSKRMDASRDKENALAAENEMIQRGEKPQAVATEDHVGHIRSHSESICDPVTKMDPMIVQAATAHIMEHIQLLSMLPPVLLQALNQPMIPQPGETMAQGQALGASVPGAGATSGPEIPQPAQPPPSTGE